PPKKEVIWPRNCLHDRWVWLAFRTKRPEKSRAKNQGKNDYTREHKIFAERVRYKRHPVLGRQIVILLEIRRALHDAAGHRPFVDSQLEDHEHMQADKGEQHARDNE